jgi:hypothetical protein
MQERSSPLWRLVERVYGGRGEESACVDTVVRVGGGGMPVELRVGSRLVVIGTMLG